MSKNENKKEGKARKERRKKMMRSEENKEQQRNPNVNHTTIELNVEYELNNMKIKSHLRNVSG